jgi:hypothetical protein
VPAGYSKRTLADKLGIKPGTRVVALGAPSSYLSLIGGLPGGATVHSRLPTASGFIHRFVRSQDELAADFPRLARSRADNGTLWISWPKKASGMDTDLNENIIRELGL